MLMFSFLGDFFLRFDPKIIYSLNIFNTMIWAIKDLMVLIETICFRHEYHFFSHYATFTIFNMTLSSLLNSKYQTLRTRKMYYNNVIFTVDEDWDYEFNELKNVSTIRFYCENF